MNIHVSIQVCCQLCDEIFNTNLIASKYILLIWSSLFFATGTLMRIPLNEKEYLYMRISFILKLFLISFTVLCTPFTILPQSTDWYSIAKKNQTWNLYSWSPSLHLAIWFLLSANILATILIYGIFFNLFLFLKKKCVSSLKCSKLSRRQYRFAALHKK